MIILLGAVILIVTGLNFTIHFRDVLSQKKTATDTDATRAKKAAQERAPEDGEEDDGDEDDEAHSVSNSRSS